MKITLTLDNDLAQAILDIAENLKTLAGAGVEEKPKKTIKTTKPKKVEVVEDDDEDDEEEVEEKPKKSKKVKEVKEVTEKDKDLLRKAFRQAVSNNKEGLLSLLKPLGVSKLSGLIEMWESGEVSHQDIADFL